MIIGREHRSVKIGRGIFSTNQVALRSRTRLEQIFIQFLVRLILFVVAFTVRIMQREVKIPSVVQELIPEQLIMLLVIVVDLILIIDRIAGRVLIFSTRVVAAPILLHLLFRSIVPRVIRALRAVKRNQFHDRLV